MLIRWSLPAWVLLLAEVVLAQRGGWGADGRGSWDDSQAQQVVTETQMETRTMVTTASAQPPTTIVQATTVLRVSTLQVQAQPSAITLTADGRTYTTTTSLTHPPSLSTFTVGGQPSSRVVPQDSAREELTVDPLNPTGSVSGSDTASLMLAPSVNSTDVASSSISLATTPTSAMSGDETTVTVGSGTALLPDISGVNVETTGVPNTRDAAEGVIYGSIANNAASAARAQFLSFLVMIAVLCAVAISISSR